MKKKILISIPAYNEANNIRPLYKKLNETLEEKRDEVDFEILFINDGSKDNTVSEVLSLIEQTDNVSLIDLSRNYGKEIARVRALIILHMMLLSQWMLIYNIRQLQLLI